MSEKPGPGVLWHQAKGDPERYRELMLEHGLLLRPGDKGYEDGSRNLACGWPGESVQTADNPEPEPPDMDITEWPIYVSDTYHIECHQPGCKDEEFPHPGRRVTVAEFLDAVIEHARTEHGLTIERTWGFR